LERFAEVAERVASTTKKLEKAAFVGAYLKELGDTDLARAARYFAGHQFAQNDARTTNVGGSIVSRSLRLFMFGSEMPAKLHMKLLRPRNAFRVPPLVSLKQNQLLPG